MSRSYRAYKPKLRIEFSHRCAYCKTREPEIGGTKSFHIDHYKPQKLFPELACAYDNLIYSCRDCNSYKKDYWPNVVEQFLKKFILNPRKDQTDKHIDTSGFAWSGKTAQGKWTVKKLRLDSPMLSQRRKDRTIIEGQIQELNTIIENAKQHLANDNLTFNERQNIEKIIEDKTEVIAVYTRKILGSMD